MVDRVTFAEYVRDAFAHLHDPVHLRVHALAQLLSQSDHPLSGDALRRTLLGAVDQIKPPPDAPAHTASWRRYRYLQMRYAEGASHQAVAEELAISTRQAHRDGLEALEAVTLILWEMRRARPSHGGGEKSAPESPHDEPPDRQADLHQELLKAKSEEAGPTDLHEAVEGVVGLARRLAEKAGGSIEVDLRAILPPVAVDRTGLRQILLNLLSYIVEVEPAGRIALSAGDSGDVVEVRIIGREGSRRRRSRTAPANASGDAAALLAAGQHLAEVHRVEVSVSNPDDGPIDVEVVVPSTRRLTVLVIDDNPDVGQLFHRFLRNTGYRVIHARTWQQALGLAGETQPDLITLDLMMPSQDGWDILRLLRELPGLQNTPVIICSVLPERTLTAAMGLSDFLPKPITRHSLIKALRAASRAHPRDLGSPDSARA